MRQFVFALLIAGIVVGGYWWYGASPANASDSGELVDLGTMQQSPRSADQKPQPLANPALANPALASPALASPALASEASLLEQALVKLSVRLAANEPAARDEAQRILARADLPTDLRARLQNGLLQPGESPQPQPVEVAAKLAVVEVLPNDLPTILVRLGKNNAFLHTVDGRELARRALLLTASMSDEQAIPIMTDLLERCMRGPIQKQDTTAHEAVDQLIAQYRIRADRYICDPANLARARSLTVGNGDSLQAIAARFRKEGLQVEDGTLAVLNRIHNPNAIQIGQRVKAPVDPIFAVLEKRSFLLGVYVGDLLLRVYWVGHGENDKTPVTEFTVADKIANPPWYAPDGQVFAYGDPKNILGKYFIKFSNPSYSGFGAHGTPMPETIGTMSSMGCIRMYDKDIEELYKLLPRKAKVLVRDSD